MIKGPTGHRIKIGGPTWIKLSKTQQDALVKASKIPVKKAAAKKEVKKAPVKKTVKKVPAKKEVKKAPVKKAVKKVPVRKTVKKVEAPSTSAKKLPTVPKKKIPQKPCKSELECSAVFEKSKFHETSYWLLTGDFGDCTSLKVQSFKAGSHQKAIEHILKVANAESLLDLIQEDYSFWIARFLAGTKQGDMNLMLVFDTPESREVMKLLAREGLEAKGKPVPAALTPSKIPLPSPSGTPYKTPSKVPSPTEEEYPFGEYPAPFSPRKTTGSARKSPSPKKEEGGGGIFGTIAGMFGATSRFLAGAPSSASTSPTSPTGYGP